MKLITQPEDGIAPLLSAVKRAKRTLDVVIFRIDLKELEEALAAAVKRGVVVRALIANTNKGGAPQLRKLEQRMLKKGVTVCRTDDEMAVSCSRAIAAGDKFSVLRRKVESDCFPRGAPRRAASSAPVLSGRKSICRIASPDEAMASRSTADSA